MGSRWRVRIHGHGGHVRGVSATVSVANGELRVTCGSHTAGWDGESTSWAVYMVWSS
jgi:hypothetical protein